tara:strand:- start:98 stop:325 length:228 start_codon:yes stop_codon:yes gene_type:complete
MTNYEAIMIVEGVNEPKNRKQYLKAWQILVNTGMAWRLQGWFGRTAETMIENGDILSKEDWEIEEKFKDPRNFIT